MANDQVLNTDSDLIGNTLVTAEGARTISGLYTFSRAPAAPFAVQAGSANVANLDAAKLNGQIGSFYQNASNITTGTLPLAQRTSSTVTLLHTVNGSSVATGATTLDTFTMPTTLTGADFIVIKYMIGPFGGTLTLPVIYSVTDAATIQSITGGNVATGAYAMGTIDLSQFPGIPITYMASSYGTAAGSGAINSGGFYSATASWNAGWTIGLRHGGLSAGTVYYHWNIYLYAGE